MSLWILIRKLVVTSAGLFIIALGLLLLVLPGPGILLILLGLLVLAIEYPALRKLVEKIREKRKGKTGNKRQESG